jgi:hypothetical protein
MVFSIDASEGELPFLCPVFPLEHEKCTLLSFVKSLLDRVPQEVSEFLLASLADPVFTHMRMHSGRTEDIPRTRQLCLLYRALRRIRRVQLAEVVGAISLITGLSPQIILEHNRVSVKPRQLTILQTIYEKVLSKSPSPVFTFSGRIEATEASEILPRTFLWLHSGNPFVGMKVPDWLFDHDLQPKEIRATYTKAQRALLKPLLPDELPANLSPQHRWLLTAPPLRRTLRMPFFFTKDLSDGCNPMHGLPPVPCFNELDDQRPPPIQWILDLELPEIIPGEYYGCQCVKGDCRFCHQMTIEGEPPIVYTEDGKIELEQLNTCRPLIIECNPECQCSELHSRNRIVANRSRVRLMVVRSTLKNGWGVRTMEFIPKGAFVCEYLGSVIHHPVVAELKGFECDRNSESDMFDLDAYAVKDVEMMTVDPSRVGNVSRYINHSCDPNLVQISVGSVKSRQFHRVGFFAARNICPNEELGFHYRSRFNHDHASR